jgi:hypothetical protein
MRPHSFALVTLSLLSFVPQTWAAGSKGPAFVCTQVMGGPVTGRWFGAGFESGNDDARWQALIGDQIVSPCTKKSARPDRIVFTAVDEQLKTADEWIAALTRTVKALKTRYPGLKNIELVTTLRGPGNKTCGSPLTVVDPVIDEAVAKVAAAFPRLVTVGPKFEAPDCQVFARGGPDFSPDGMARVANLYAAHYLK